MDPYKYLNVRKDISIEDLKKRFHELSLIHHPDKGGKAETFSEISVAYKTLLKEINDRKISYDVFEDISNDSPVYEDVSLSLEEIYLGKTINVKLEHSKQCGSCITEQCCECKGVGKICKNVSLIGIKSKVYIQCNKCDGLGHVITGCSVCNMTGIIDVYSVHTVNIRRGVRDNEQIPIKHTNVIIVIHELPHARFYRFGNDVILIQNISLYDALFGINVQCRHLNGKSLMLSLIKNDVVQSDVLYYIKDMGMPFNNKYGTFIIKFNIHFPKSIECNDTKEKVMLKKMLNVVGNTTHSFQNNITTSILSPYIKGNKQLIRFISSIS